MFVNKFGQFRNVHCGLIVHNQDAVRAVPLESVIIRASLVSAVAKVELTQVFVNKEEQPIEAIYYFPVDSEAGVTHFQAELEGRLIEGSVKPLKEAQDQYEKAVEENQSAFLLESNKPDVFKIRIGFLKPGCQVKITIGYVTEVKNEKGTNSIRFFIPTTVAPRYIPAGEAGEECADLKNMEFSDKSPASLSISVNVAIQGEIKAIESPTHKIEIEAMESLKKNWSRAVVQLFGKTTDMDRDFVLLVVPEENHVPRLYCEKSSNSTALMAHLIPSFNLKAEKVELVFVLDRSGSMQGASIELAKQALILFLHSLPVDCYFNVVGFGSSYQFMFPNSVRYDDDSLRKASQHCKALDADLGGTEIYEPLSKIFQQKLVPEYSRQIFVLTDGEVGNTDQVIELCKQNSGTSRIFSLGIGAAASHYLVEGIAMAGGGTAVFVSYKEAIEARVLQQLKNATQSSLNNVRIEWPGVGSTPESGAEISTKTWKQTPENVPPVFDGSQLLVFGLFPGKVEPQGIKISADSPEGTLSVELELSEENDGGSNGILHKLAAIKTIRDLEMKIRFAEQGIGNLDEGALEILKKELIDIACEHGLVSKYTAYIAVDKTNGAGNIESTENWVMQTRYVPSQYAQGWHGRTMADTGLGYGMLRACAVFDADVEMVETKKNLSYRQYRSKSLTASSCPSSGLFGCASKTRPAARNRSAVKLCSSYEIEPISTEECDFEEYRPAVAPFPPRGKESIKSAPKDYLHAIVVTQSFNGSFPLNEAFAEAICKKLETLKSIASTEGWDENAWATGLAIVFFQEKLTDLQDSWEMVALKAKNWLEKNHSGIMEFIMIKASAVLKLEDIAE